MVANLEQIKADLDALSRIQRAELIEHLIVTLDAEADPELDELWVAEINRRVQRVLSGESVGIPGDQVAAEMRAKLR